MWMLPCISETETQHKNYFPTKNKKFWNLTQVCLLHVSENITSFDAVIYHFKISTYLQSNFLISVAQDNVFKAITVLHFELKHVHNAQ
jgi:hypothetical protein